MKRISLCSISKNISAPCVICGKAILFETHLYPAHRAATGKISWHNESASVTAVYSTRFYCPDCCPEHGKPPLLEGAA